MLCQVIATAEKYVRGYGRKPFNPSRHLAGRNTQENGELLLATLQQCNPRYDALMNDPIHTNLPLTPTWSVLLRRYCRVVTSVRWREASSGFPTFRGQFAPSVDALAMALSY